MLGLELYRCRTGTLWRRACERLLHLGTHHVYLALGWRRGRARSGDKIGDSFSKGVEVSVVCLPEGKIPILFSKNKESQGF